MVEDIEKLPSGTKISEYYQELEHMEAEEKSKKDLLTKKENGLKELQDLREKFASKDRGDIVEKIEADITALKKEIQEMKKSS